MKSVLGLIALTLLITSSCGSAQENLTSVAEAAPIAAIDPALWLRLNDALQQQIAERNGSATIGIDGLYVDCIYFFESSTSDYYIDWNYLNPGDYDQNSEVNISDLARLGLNFGYTPSYPQWPMAQLADGDGNGEVNIADVTPIGVHFGNRVVKYTIEGFHKEHNVWEFVAEQTFADGYASDSFPGRQFNYYFHDYTAGGAYSDFRVCTVGE